jgi:hypothetical protein
MTVPPEIAVVRVTESGNIVVSVAVVGLLLSSPSLTQLPAVTHKPVIAHVAKTNSLDVFIWDFLYYFLFDL